jgi:hypothetical protein
MNNHQKKAKYCLLIQGKIDVKRKTDFNCKYCKKNLISKQKLSHHLDICDKKCNFLLNEIKEKDQIIIKIKTQNENYKEQNLNYRAMSYHSK